MSYKNITVKKFHKKSFEPRTISRCFGLRNCGKLHCKILSLNIYATLYIFLTNEFKRTFYEYALSYFNSFRNFYENLDLSDRFCWTIFFILQYFDIRITITLFLPIQILLNIFDFITLHINKVAAIFFQKLRASKQTQPYSSTPKISVLKNSL